MLYVRVEKAYAIIPLKVNLGTKNELRDPHNLNLEMQNTSRVNTTTSQPTKRTEEEEVAKSHHHEIQRRRRRRARKTIHAIVIEQQRLNVHGHISEKKKKKYNDVEKRAL